MFLSLWCLWWEVWDNCIDSWSLPSFLFCRALPHIIFYTSKDCVRAYNKTRFRMVHMFPFMWEKHLPTTLHKWRQGSNIAIFTKPEKKEKIRNVYNSSYRSSTVFDNLGLARWTGIKIVWYCKTQHIRKLHSQCPANGVHGSGTKALCGFTGPKLTRKVYINKFGWNPSTDIENNQTLL